MSSKVLANTAFSRPASENSTAVSIRVRATNTHEWTGTERKQRNRRHQNPDAQTAGNPAAHIAGDHHVRGDRRDQQFFNIALEFGAEKEDATLA